jgi:hypothetical protein
MVDAARTDLAALDKVTRLFDPAQSDEIAVDDEFGSLWEPGEVLPTGRQALEPGAQLDARESAPPVAEAKRLDAAALFKPIGIWVARALSSVTARALFGGAVGRNGIRLWKRNEALIAEGGERDAIRPWKRREGLPDRSPEGAAEVGACGATQTALEAIPGEFFYLDWP